MKNKLVFTIHLHPKLGYILSAFFVEKKKHLPFYSIIELVTPNNFNTSTYNFSEKEKKLITLIEQYSVNELIKIFIRKKITTKEFLEQLAEDFFKERIRPFIENRLNSCFSIIRENNIDCYYRADDNTNFYENDKLAFMPDLASTVFNFERINDSLRYFLNIQHQQTVVNLTHTSGGVLTDSPCWLLINHKVYLFNDIEGKKLKPFFVKNYIEVPKTALRKYFETFILNCIKSYEVRAKGFEIKYLQPTQKAELCIQTNLKNEHCFAINFKYDKHLFKHNSPNSNIVKLNENAGEYSFTVLKRNLQWESEKCEKLFSLGLEQKQEAFFTLKNNQNFQNLEELIDWLRKNSISLAENDIDINSYYNSKQYSVKNADLDLTVNDKIDWFDLKISIIVGEHEIPFADIAKHISNKNKEFVLPTGEIFFIPNAWFATLDDIITHSTAIMGHLHLPKNYAGLLKNQDIKKENIEQIKRLCDINFESVEPPQLLKTQLRDYQTIGYSWLLKMREKNFGACLADDMGLGKTVQVISLLLKVYENKNIEQDSQKKQQLNLFSEPDKNKHISSSLIIVPNTLLDNWLNELKKFAPILKVHLHFGSERTKSNKIFSSYHLILTTYGLMRNDNDLLASYNFEYIILDESQSIKNPNSKNYECAKSLNSNNKLIINGTPIENSLQDLWSQMDFLNDGLLGNLEFFNEKYLLPIQRMANNEVKNRLKKIIQPFILRRTKGEVNIQLPPCTEQVVSCEMLENQQEIYEKTKSEVRNELMLNKQNIDFRNFAFRILQALMRLRQIANHPKMYDPDFTGSSGKFDIVCEQLENLAFTEHKVIISSSFVKHLSLFEDFFQKKKYAYKILTGQTPQNQRQNIVSEFNNDPDVRFFLLTMKTGGVGLNIQAADYVFILDPWWNPATENQVIARAHRIGQTRRTFVYRFVTQNSIEEKIELLKQRKSDLAEVFINQNNPLQSLSKNELIELLN